MAVIEIQTIEGGRLEWVAIYSDSNTERAMGWGNRLLLGTLPKPNLRILDRLHGSVIGAWQSEGYEADDS
jgi:hypothetical protein